jgi:anti-sigma factor RsiW
MNCIRTKELFVDYQDGVLSKKDNSELEEHLGKCDSCAAEWAIYQKTMNEISGLHYVAPEEGFTSRVKKTIGRRSRGRFFGSDQSYSLKFAVISFILILFFLLAYFYLSANTVVKEITSSENQNSDPGKKIQTENMVLPSATGNKNTP